MEDLERLRDVHLFIGILARLGRLRQRNGAQFDDITIAWMVGSNGLRL
jgi:hypothetical protein